MGLNPLWLGWPLQHKLLLLSPRPFVCVPWYPHLMTTEFVLHPPMSVLLPVGRALHRREKERLSMRGYFGAAIVSMALTNPGHEGATA